MRNKKRISILLVMAMVMTLLAGLAAPAAAAPVAPFNVFSSGFTNVIAGDNRIGGTVTAQERESNSWGGVADSIFVSVTLPEGVTFNTTPTSGNVGSYVTVTGATYAFEAAASNMLRVRVTPSAGTDSVSFNFAADALSRLNVGSGVTGDIRATVDVHRIVDGAVQWIESDTRTIARVAPLAVTVTAAAPTLVTMGSGRAAARITIAEGTAGSIAVNETIYLEIVTPDVSFTAAPTLPVHALGVTATTLVGTAPHRSAYFTVTDDSAVFAGRILLDSSLTVNPGVTGDITITVRSTRSGTVVPTTTLTVATVGAAAVEVTGVANNTDSVIAGHTATVLETAAGSARFNLRATGGATLPAPRIVVLALSGGARFEAVAKPFLVDSRVGTGGWAMDRAPVINLFADNTSAWFEIPDNIPTPPYGWNATELRIRDLRVSVPGDAAAGDLKVTLSGTLGATGDVVIGTIARPFTATAETPALAYPGLNQAAANIVITETARGAIAGDLVLELPHGVSFNPAVRPRARVTAGDLRIATDVAIDTALRTITIDVTGASTVPSTITIDRISYDVTRAAMEGNVSVRISGTTGWIDTRTLATVANATVGVVAPPANVFTIGALSFVRAGVTTPITVAPTIVEGRTLLALRYAAIAVGVSEEDIIWDAGRRTATLFRGDRVVQLRVGDRHMTINGVVVPLEVPAAISNGRIVLPIRAVATALRAGIVWDATARTVTVTP